MPPLTAGLKDGAGAGRAVGAGAWPEVDVSWAVAGAGAGAGTGAGAGIGAGGVVSGGVPGFTSALASSNTGARAGAGAGAVQVQVRWRRFSPPAGKPGCLALAGAGRSHWRQEITFASGQLDRFHRRHGSGAGSAARVRARRPPGLAAGEAWLSARSGGCVGVCVCSALSWRSSWLSPLFAFTVEFESAARAGAGAEVGAVGFLESRITPSGLRAVCWCWAVCEERLPPIWAVVSCSPLPGFSAITAARIATERPEARLALGKRRSE